MTASTRAQLTTEVAANFTTNGIGGITGAIARTTFADFIASFATLGDTNTFTTGNTFAPVSGDAITITPAALSNSRGFTITQSGPNSSIAGPKSYNDITVTNLTGISTVTFSNGLPNNRLDGLHVTYLSGVAASGTYQSAVHGELRLTAAGSNSTAFGLWGSAYTNIANSNTNAALGGLDGYAIVDSSGSVGLVEGAVFEAGIRTGGVALFRAAIVLDNIGAAQATTLDSVIIITNYSGWNGASDAGAYKNLIAISKAGGAMGSGVPLDATASFFVSDTALTVTNIYSGANITVTGNYWAGTNVLWQGSNGFLTLGSTNAPDAALTVNNNSGATVAPTLNTAIHLVGADASLVTQTFDAFGSFGVTLARVSGGTRASKSAFGANGNAYQFAAQTWDGAAYTTNAVISFKSVNAQSGTDHSSTITFQTVPTGATALAEAGRFNPSGSLSVGTTTDGGIGSVLANTSIKSQGATGGIGYATGAGGTVTQGAGSGKATAVTLNTVTGAITMNNAALAAATIVSFVLNDSAVTATDMIVAEHESGGTIGSYTINARATGSGTASIDVRNNTAGSLSEAIVVRFAVIKSVNS